MATVTVNNGETQYELHLSNKISDCFAHGGITYLIVETSLADKEKRNSYFRDSYDIKELFKKCNAVDKLPINIKELAEKQNDCF